MKDLPITDNHIHVDPVNGDGPLEVAKKFQKAGGTVMIIPNKPTWTMGESYNLQETMEEVIKYVQEINENVDVKAFAVVGAHPAELSRLIKEGISLDKAEEMMKDALQDAQKLVLEGKAIAIGEIGRPHYEASSEEMEVHNRLMLRALQCSCTRKVPGKNSFGNLPRWQKKQVSANTGWLNISLAHLSLKKKTTA